MLLSNIFQTPKAQVFSECKIPRVYRPHVCMSPQKLQSSRQYKNFLTNSRKYLCTFQLFIDATRQQIFGHNNIRVINTSVDSRFHILDLFGLCGVFVILNLHPIAIQIGCRWVDTVKMPNGMIAWRNVGWERGNNSHVVLRFCSLIWI